VAWREAPGVFLYAARSASSRAATSVPCSIPLSRSISRTASMISWLMTLPFVDEVAPDELAVRDGDRLIRVGGDGQGLVVRSEDDAAEALAPADLARGAERDAAAEGIAKVGRLAERPLEAGRRHVDRVVAPVAVQDAGDPLAQRVVDPLRV